MTESSMEYLKMIGIRHEDLLFSIFTRKVVANRFKIKYKNFSAYNDVMSVNQEEVSVLNADIKIIPRE